MPACFAGFHASTILSFDRAKRPRMEKMMDCFFGRAQLHECAEAAGKSRGAGAEKLSSPPYCISTVLDKLKSITCGSRAQRSERAALEAQSGQWSRGSTVLDTFVTFSS